MNQSNISLSALMAEVEMLKEKNKQLEENERQAKIKLNDALTHSAASAREFQIIYNQLQQHSNLKDKYNKLEIEIETLKKENALLSVATACTPNSSMNAVFAPVPPMPMIRAPTVRTPRPTKTPPSTSQNSTMHGSDLREKMPTSSVLNPELKNQQNSTMSATTALASRDIAPIPPIRAPFPAPVRMPRSTKTPPGTSLPSHNSTIHGSDLHVRMPTPSVSNAELKNQQNSTISSKITLANPDIAPVPPIPMIRAPFSAPVRMPRSTKTPPGTSLPSHNSTIHGSDLHVRMPTPVLNPELKNQLNSLIYSTTALANPDIAPVPPIPMIRAPFSAPVRMPRSTKTPPGTSLPSQNSTIHGSDLHVRMPTASVLNPELKNQQNSTISSKVRLASSDISLVPSVIQAPFSVSVRTSRPTKTPPSTSLASQNSTMQRSDLHGRMPTPSVLNPELKNQSNSTSSTTTLANHDITPLPPIPMIRAPFPVTVTTPRPTKTPSSTSLALQKSTMHGSNLHERMPTTSALNPELNAVFAPVPPTPMIRVPTLVRTPRLTQTPGLPCASDDSDNDGSDVGGFNHPALVKYNKGSDNQNYGGFHGSSDESDYDGSDDGGGVNIAAITKYRKGSDNQNDSGSFATRGYTHNVGMNNDSPVKREVSINNAGFPPSLPDSEPDYTDDDETYVNLGMRNLSSVKTVSAAYKVMEEDKKATIKPKSCFNDSSDDDQPSESVAWHR